MNNIELRETLRLLLEQFGVLYETYATLEVDYQGDIVTGTVLPETQELLDELKEYVGE